MTVQQIYELMNNVTNEVVGKSGLVKEDLSNVVDLGKTILDSTSIDNYVKSLVDRIGKVIFVNRAYSGNVPSVLMDGWEFGSVLEKIECDIPQASENSEWNLQNGQSYDVNVFYKPTVNAKFFNSKVTFEIPISITERQVKESFTSAEQLNGFISMIYNSVDKSLAIKIDSLIMRTINNFTAQTLFNAFGANSENSATFYNDKTHVRAVNLLTLYANSVSGTGIAVPTNATQAITDTGFIKFATYTISLYRDRLSKMSTLFNIGGKERFTPNDLLHIVLLADFADASESYLQANTFHNELVKLPNYEKVPYWQGSGTSYNFNDVSSVNVTIDNPTANGTIDVSASGIIGVMFDRDALGVCNLDRRTTTNYNAKGEFWNNYYKFDASYFNDANENFVVFFVA